MPCLVFSRGHFLADDGACAACPATASTWDQYGTLVLLLCCLAGFALAVFCTVGIAVVIAGGRLKDLAKVRELFEPYLLSSFGRALYAAPCSLPLCRAWHSW